MHPIGPVANLSLLLDATSELFAIPLEDLRGPSRIHELVRARQLAWYVAHEHLGFSYPVIATEFGRDHTTILHGVRRIAEMLNDGETGVERRVDALLYEVT